MANVVTPPSEAPAAALDAEGLDRGVGFIGLLWASETSIIGSGWLFGALGAATIAGPAAIIGWVLGTVIILFLALVHAELGGLFPVSGGTSRFPHYAFGSFAGATFGWASYLQAASVAPIEVLAAIQYLSTAHWARHFFHATAAAGSAHGTLHGWGYLAAAIMLLIFVVINIVGIRQFARINNAITTLESGDSRGHSPDPADRALPRLELRPRRRRLLPEERRDQGDSADAAGRDHLLPAGLRAGGTARRRVGQSRPRPAARRDPVAGHRRGPLHPHPDRLHRGAQAERAHGQRRLARPGHEHEPRSRPAHGRTVLHAGQHRGNLVAGDRAANRRGRLAGRDRPYVRDGVRAAVVRAQPQRLRPDRRSSA